MQQIRRPIDREPATLSRRRVTLMITATPAMLGACTAIELPDPTGSMAERDKTTASDPARLTASAMRDGDE